MLAIVMGLASCSRSVDAVLPLDCAAAGGGDPACAPTTWPTAGHGANSDPWLVAHHDVITQMSPRVMVLDFDNGATPDQVMATAQLQASALAEGSRYHGYADSAAVPFLKIQITKVVDLTDHPPPSSWTHPSSTLLPTTSTGEFDATALFTARFNDSYGFDDPSSPSGSLSLCQLFEQGLINEVWIEDGEPDVRRAPLNVERKQAYDASGAAVPGMFLPDVGGGGSLNQIVCGVTVRMAHLDPARGPGCDLQVRGWGIDGMWDALPAVAADARAFLNADFDSRFGVQFASFADICDMAGDSCVTYPSQTVAAGRYADGRGWRIDPFLQGCGSSRFPPNARGHGDFVHNAPVQARCAGFGLGGGADGGDVYAPYTSSTVAGQESAFPDCGGGWQIYWRQSMPGPGNHAHGAGGRPIKNWWPYLYY
ncbi:MAG TPA: hypothetical protein VLT58_12645 [Polyangia bacterium]|nr:hypothetical protein [Polyangia bacterium]